MTMQPTNSDIDYEKVLQIYFHYDEDRIIEIGEHLQTGSDYLYSKSDIGRAIYDIYGLEYEDTRNFPPWIKSINSYDVLLLYEYFTDWNEATGEFEDEMKMLERIMSDES